MVTRTNIKIDLDEYVEIIAKDIPGLKLNIDDYNIIIEGNGRIIKGLKGYNVYSEEELVKDGSVKVVIN